MYARGPSAVTIDGVLRAAHVARATLYRHFSGSEELLAATFDNVITPAPNAPDQGHLEDRLRALVLAQAETIAKTPPHVTAMYWMTIGSDMETRPCVNGLGSARPDSAHSLRERLAELFSAPLADLLNTPEARVRFGDVDTTVAFALLVGPLVLGRACLVAGFDYRGCAESAVQGFLLSHSRGNWADASEVTRELA